MAGPFAEIAPIPPRYRWTRRIAKALLVTFIVLFVVRIAWAWEARRRLSAAIRECRSPTRPLLPEDFAQPPIPRERNAAVILERALASYVRLDDPWLQDRLDRSAATAADLTRLRQWLGQNTGPRADLRRARDLPADWNEVPLRNFNELLYNKFRPRAPVLMFPAHCAAELSTRDGDHAAAVEYGRDALACARATFASLNSDTYYPRLIFHDEVTSGILRRPVALGPGSVAKPATTAQVRALLADLLDERSFTEGIHRMWCAERQLYLEFLAALKDGRIGSEIDPERDQVKPPTTLERATIRVTAPFLDLKAEACLREMTAAIAAFEHAPQGYRAVMSRLPSQRAAATQTGAYPADHVLAMNMLPAYDTRAQLYFQSLTQRRAAAVAVAMRLYAHDHGGNPPTTLQQLVPKYLPSVPADPFADGKSPLGYLPSPRPVVYSVGINGIDNLRDGSYPFPRLQTFGRDVWESPDAVFELQ